MQAGKLGAGRGFTLVEVVIALAIVGILAAVAFPAYTAYQRRAKIAAALAELSTAQVRLEQYYQDNRNYGSTGTTCGVGVPAAPGFTFSCNWGAGATPQSFLLTATGNAGAGLGGFAYTLDHAGQKRTPQFEGEAVDAPCWIVKRGEAC